MTDRDKTLALETLVLVLIKNTLSPEQVKTLREDLQKYQSHLKTKNSSAGSWLDQYLESLMHASGTNMEAFLKPLVR